MPESEPRLVDSKVDRKLVDKLDRLNKKYRLGLSIRDYPTDLPIPSYVREVEYEAWNEIRDKISSLHKTVNGRTKLSSALSSYEAWAKKQRGESHWQDKPHADPRVLGAPHSHIEQLRRVLGISRYSSNQYKKRKSEEISGASTTDMTSSNDVHYPEFSAEAQGDIARSSSGRILQATLQHSNTSSSRYSRTQADRSLNAQQDMDSSRRRKRIKSSLPPRDFMGTIGAVIETDIATSHLETAPRPYPALKSASTVQISTASATSSRQTSFNTNLSFASAAANIETPGTSFGSTIPAQQESMPPPASRKLKSSKQVEPQPIAIPKRSQHTSVSSTLPSPGSSQSDFAPSFSLEQALLGARLQDGATVKTLSESGCSISQVSQSTEGQMLQLAARIENGMLAQRPVICDSQDMIALGTPPASKETLVASQTRSGKSATRPLTNKSARLQSSDAMLSSSVPQSTASSIDRVQISQEHPVPDSKARSVSARSSTHSNKTRSSQSKIEAEVFTDGQSPFLKATYMPKTGFDFRAIYELARVSLSCDESSGTIASHSPALLAKGINSPGDGDYEAFWYTVIRNSGLQQTAPEKSSTLAWKAASSGSTTSIFSGALTVQVRGGCLEAQFSLAPIRYDKSCRFFRKFGAVRFFELDLPDLGESDLAKSFYKWLTESKHVFLGWIWRVVFTRSVQDKDKEVSFQAILFAIEECGKSCKKIPVRDINPGMKNKVTDSELCDWMLNPRHNPDQNALKLFSRMTLGFTKTTPSIIFLPRQIVRTRDARSCCQRARCLRTDQEPLVKHKHTCQIMNDGCGRISYAAAQKIRLELKLAALPYAFQGRIAGAKGVWLVDFSGELLEETEDIWIEVTDSQLKFDAHTRKSRYIDPHHLTFEVHSHTYPLKPSTLSYRTIAILSSGGVVDETFVRLLEEDLRRTDDRHDLALDAGGAILLDWLQSIAPVASSRALSGEIAMEGGFPASSAEKVIMMTANGHLPRQNRFLMDLCMDVQKMQWSQFDKKPEMKLAKTTYAFMVPDPFNVLEKDEVFLQFSQPFEDEETGEAVLSLADTSVLVMRHPAYLPSDVQKVQAVFKHELMNYKDVIVFSIKGHRSLAESLSGGDFDGDKAWVCWESRLVNHFQNSALREPPEAEDYGILVDREKTSVTMSEGRRALLHKGTRFNMKPKMLGKCSNFFMAYTYHQNSISQPISLEIGHLLGYLVDTAKNGYTFTSKEWNQFLERHGIPLVPFPHPAWLGGENVRPKPEVNIMDKLRFVITEKHRDQRLRDFKARCKTMAAYDGQLSKVWRDTCEDAARDDLRDDMKTVIKHLQAQFQPLYDTYTTTFSRPPGVSWIHQKPDPPSDGRTRRMKQELRRKFLAIEPPKFSQHPSAAKWRREARYALLSPEERQTRVVRLENEKDRYGNQIVIPQEERLLIGDGFGGWTRFKASFLHKEYSFNYRFCHTVAGKELCEIKAIVTRPLSEVFTIAQDIFTALRVDKGFVKTLISNMPTTAVSDEDNEDIRTHDDMTGGDEV